MSGRAGEPTGERLRARLAEAARRRRVLTYGELATALELSPPHTIHQVAEALEGLMAEDAAHDRPFIAALAVSKARDGLPAPGFFDCAQLLGRFSGIDAEARAFHAGELAAAFDFWGGADGP